MDKFDGLEIVHSAIDPPRSQDKELSIAGLDRAQADPLFHAILKFSPTGSKKKVHQMRPQNNWVLN